MSMDKAKEKYMLEAITQSEFEFTFKPDKSDIKRGCMGYLRGDFGSGEQFYYTWFDEDEGLKTEEFEQEFDDLVNYFRESESVPLLKSRADMGKVLQYIGAAPYKNDENIKGIKVVTENHTYYMRCFSQSGDYNFYIFCYSSSELRKYKV